MRKSKWSYETAKITVRPDQRGTSTDDRALEAAMPRGSRDNDRNGEGDDEPSLARSARAQPTRQRRARRHRNGKSRYDTTQIAMQRRTMRKLATKPR